MHRGSRRTREKNHSNLICETVKDVPSVGTTALISFSIRLEFFCPFFSLFLILLMVFVSFFMLE